MLILLTSKLIIINNNEPYISKFVLIIFNVSLLILISPG